MKSKAFTLIELLVVISIIGVIASIVLVSFSGSRDKAKIAKSQQFSANINHSLGAYAVGIWRFEEAAGIDIHDESGYGNHGTFNGNPTPVFSDGVYSGTKALQFDGVDDYIEVPDSASLNITDAITIEAWVKTNVVSEYREIMRKEQTNRLLFSIQLGDILSFGTHNGTGYSELDYPGFDNSYINKWTHLVATHDSSGVRNIYINGVSVHSDNRGAGITTVGTVNLFIGSSSGASEFFNGTIDDVRIYSEALSVGQIQQRYAQGATKHGIVLK